MSDANQLPQEPVPSEPPTGGTMETPPETPSSSWTPPERPSWTPPEKPVEPPSMTPPVMPPVITPPMPPSDSLATTSDDKLWALLAYVLSPLVPILIFVLMPDKKDRPFIKEHNAQAGVAGLIGWIVVAVIAAIPLVGCISPFLALAVWIILIYWGWQAYNGKSVTIPVVTSFVKQQGWA